VSAGQYREQAGSFTIQQVAKLTGLSEYTLRYYEKIGLIDSVDRDAHRYGINAYAAPLLHLRRAAEGGLFAGYAESFGQVKELSRPAREK
jgi:hypothetical protein